MSKKRPQHRGILERRVERVLLGALLLLTLIAILATALGGCVKAAPGLPKQCDVDKDCPGGEVCGADNLCYGNPPNEHLAVELYPPSGASGIVRTDIDNVTISQAGDVALAFVQPVTLTGRVVLASDPGLSIAAKIVFRRASRIPGGPDVVVSVDAAPGMMGSDHAFTAQLLPNVDNETYEVTIYPDDGAIYTPPGGTPTPAQITPPQRIAAVSITQNQDSVMFTLGDAAGLKQITGRVVDAAGRGIPGLAAHAYGRYLPTSKPELASSRGETDADGNFALWVPVSWDDYFDIRIEPAPGTAQPTILRTGVMVPDPMSGQFQVVVDIGDLAMPSFADAQEFQLPVFGTSTGGGLEPAAGAVVRFQTVLESTTDTQVIYRTQATVDDMGNASAPLIPGDLVAGNRTYTVDVIPLPNTPHAAAWGATIDVGPQQGGVLAMLDPLGRRVYVTGTLVDANGDAVEDATINTVPSPYYLFALGDNERDAAQALTWPSTSSAPVTGAFSLWIDPIVMGTPAIYDFSIEPPAASLLPRWTIDKQAFDQAPPTQTGQTNVDLGTVNLPPASLAHGPVTGPDGSAVSQAEIRVYMVTDNSSLCMHLGNLPGCHAPAVLRALTDSMDDGAVRLVLPSP